MSGTQATATIEVVQQTMPRPNTGNAGLVTATSGPAAWQWAALTAAVMLVAGAAVYTRRRIA